MAAVVAQLDLRPASVGFIAPEIARAVARFSRLTIESALAPVAAIGPFDAQSIVTRAIDGYAGCTRSRAIGSDGTVCVAVACSVGRQLIEALVLVAHAARDALVL